MFHLNVGTAILALILGFIFSFIAVQSSGHTDINPVGTVAKASQLVFGGISKGAGMSVVPAQTVNLAAGVIAAGSAAQSSDMVGDLKTGYLLGAKPKNQFIAQIVGGIVAVFVSTGLFLLFTKASPCILSVYLSPSLSIADRALGTQSLATPASMVLPRLPHGQPLHSLSPPRSFVCPPVRPEFLVPDNTSTAIPKTSAYAALGLGIASVLTVLIKHFLIPKKYWHWVPNWVCRTTSKRVFS